MEGMGESKTRASQHLMNAEGSVASINNLLLPPVLETFVFDSTNMSPEFLDDIFSISDESPADQFPQMAWKNKSKDGGSGATLVEAQRCRHPLGSCISSATQVLKSIQVRSPTCLFGRNSQGGEPRSSRAVDSILSANQAGQSAVRDILVCPCHSSPQLQLLVAVICAELIAWYQKVIGIYSHRSSSLSTNTGGEPMLTERAENGKAREGISLRRPFLVGDHCLEPHLEMLVICQILSTKLQELEDIVGDIYCNAKQSAANTNPGMDEDLTDPGEAPLLDAMRSRMRTYLENQLGASRRDLAAFRGELTRGVGRHPWLAPFTDSSRGNVPTVQGYNPITFQY